MQRNQICTLFFHKPAIMQPHDFNWPYFQSDLTFHCKTLQSYIPLSGLFFWGQRSRCLKMTSAMMPELWHTYLHFEWSLQTTISTYAIWMFKHFSLNFKPDNCFFNFIVFLSDWWPHIWIQDTESLTPTQWLNGEQFLWL